MVAVAVVLSRWLRGANQTKHSRAGFSSSARKRRSRAGAAGVSYTRLRSYDGGRAVAKRRNVSSVEAENGWPENNANAGNGMARRDCSAERCDDSVRAVALATNAGAS
jgi:hypothetical protein